MIRVADYIFQWLADRGVRHVFLVTGGGAMFLNDALRCETRIKPVCQHHEQACAMAAEGYARIAGTPGVACVTTGPGGINALNGVFGAWTDSIPLLVLSGQVKRETCMSSYPHLPLRQLGDQEADIISMAKGITKYAEQVVDPQSIRAHLERAWALATSGRPGPCWLDIPLDVQNSRIDPETLPAAEPIVAANGLTGEALTIACREVLARLRAAERPVILAGTGVRLAGAVEPFRRVARRLGIPVTTAWTHDLIASDDPLCCGRPGTIGTRAGNFTVQNADVLLVLGSRLNIRQTSYNFHGFAPHAYKIQVDIDQEEMRKPFVTPDLAIHSDARQFLACLDGLLEGTDLPARHADWLAWCRERVQRYPNVLPEQRTTAPPINPYHFIDRLFAALGPEDIIACGNATATIVPFQAGQLQAGQRMFSNSGAASMGYDLPAAIGAAFAHGTRVICLAGDGSLQMNIQELQTVAHYRLPIKLFVLNNNGYLSIRGTQRNFFQAVIGESPDSDVTFPDYTQVARAYGLPAVRLTDPADLDARMAQLLADPGPAVCEVMLDPEQEFSPRMKSRALPDGRLETPPLEDMFPFLSREELAENMPGTSLIGRNAR